MLLPGDPILPGTVFLSPQTGTWLAVDPIPPEPWNDEDFHPMMRPEAAEETT